MLRRTQQAQHLQFMAWPAQQACTLPLQPLLKLGARAVLHGPVCCCDGSTTSGLPPSCYSTSDWRSILNLRCILARIYSQLEEAHRKQWEEGQQQQEQEQQQEQGGAAEE